MVEWRPLPGPERPDTVDVNLLSFSARVTSNSPRILRGLLSLYPTATPASGGMPSVSALRLGIVKAGAEGRCDAYRLYRSGRQIDACSTALRAIAGLEYLIDTAAIVSLGRYVLVHAGAVAAGTGGIVLPAASGAGKSTLVAALCLSGFRYLSDELAVLDGETDTVHPFAKAICLKSGGWRVMNAAFDLPAVPFALTRCNGRSARFLEAPAVSAPRHPVRVRYVLLPTRQAGRPATLAPTSRAGALAELARHSLNLPRHRHVGLEILARLVEGAACYTLTYDDVRAATAAVTALVGS